MIKHRPETMIEDGSHQRIFGQTFGGSLDYTHGHILWSCWIWDNFQALLGDLLNVWGWIIGGSTPLTEYAHDYLADHAAGIPEYDLKTKESLAWPPHGHRQLIIWLPWLLTSSFLSYNHGNCSRPNTQLMRINYWATNINIEPQSYFSHLKYPLSHWVLTWWHYWPQSTIIALLINSN